MENALTTGYDRQGRSLSPSMQARYIAAVSAPPRVVEENYRGFRISGARGKSWYVTGATLWQTSYTTQAHARAAVDRCLALRAES